MKFSVNFLKEFLKVDVSKEKLVAVLTMAGIGVGALDQIEGDITAEIEVTSNRYDWLSMVGLARELAASLDEKLNIDYPKVIKTPIYKGKNIVIKDNQDCPLYVARFFSNVKVGPSPAWLKERVLHCGVSSINNIVDITNYMMLKWGNPLHAFDARKVEGTIYIRRARQDEKFIGLDDKERTLDPTNLVIADEKKIIALAGVMGARNSEVDATTTEVIIEAAIFSPLTVRRSRRAAGVDTDSSYRFERQVFAQHLEYASAQSGQLIEKLAQGKANGYKEAGKAPKISPVAINFDADSANEYLGTNIDIKKTKKILISLGCKISSGTKGKFKVVVPAFRFDIKEAVDLYEEVARVYGYENIPLAYPNLTPQDTCDKISEFKTALRTYAATLGLKEIITYSAQAESELAKLGEKDFIQLTNPLRAQENTLRTTLLLGMTKTIAYNLNRSREGLRFFEIAHVYNRATAGFSEKPCLAIGISAKEHDFFYLKSITEKIMRFVNPKQWEFLEASVPYFTNALKVSSGTGAYIGFLGKLDTKVRDDFDLKEDVFFAQLDIGALYSNMVKLAYVPFSSFPAVYRDISIAMREDKQFKQIEMLLKEKTGHLCDYRIIDTYAGRDLPKEHKAFTLRVYYQSQTRTLTSEEIDTTHTIIRTALSGTDGILLR